MPQHLTFNAPQFLPVLRKAGAASRPYTLSLLLFLCSGSATADTKATTTEGRIVILRDDGTWVYETAPVLERPAAAVACDALIKVSVDEVTGSSMTVASEILVSDDSKTGLRISLFRTAVPTTIWLTKLFGGPRCVDEGDEMNILFTDGTRMGLTNNSKFNCDSEFTLYFGGVFGRKKEFADLATKTIKTIRVWGHGEYIQREVAEDRAVAFRESMACLLK